MSNLLYVFLGGGLGSLCRYAIGQYMTTESSFPFGTFVTNIFACLILGVLLGFQTRENFQDNYSLLFITGFCGGFSTFSTFSGESLRLFQTNQAGIALLYIGVSIIFGLLSVYIGYKIQTSQ
ncbi:MAG: CrcB protein [Saprospiraceae bacterium]|jgi:CrcB protein